MIEFNPSTHVFTYLFNRSPLVVPYKRESPHEVQVTLEDDFCKSQAYTLTWHEKDQRVLVIVDGDFMSHALPKSSAVIQSLVVGDKPGNIANFRKRRLEEEGLPPSLWQFGDSLSLQVHRHFILMPASTMAFRRYRAANLAPRYSLVCVEKIANDRARVTTHSSS
jgi:hypothetical protein